MFDRRAAVEVEQRLAETAAVVLLGPRQVGKTTLARDFVDRVGGTYLDLERPADARRLADADSFLRSKAGSLVVLDEIHRAPDLFEILRGIIDDNRRAGRRHGQFLLLGSASLALLEASSESLAGRVAHVSLRGVNVDEAAAAGVDEDVLWLRGGFPDSLAADTDGMSMRWRHDLIRSYLERDVALFAPRVPAETLRRLWTMLAHNSGGLFNAAGLGQSLGVSGPTVDRYVDLLVDLLLLRRLRPWHTNTGKRETKAPKIHVRDSGLLHGLLELESLDAVLGHPAVGASYESFAVEAVIDAVGDRGQPYFYRTAKGDEVDLVIARAGRPWLAIEIKRSAAPKPTAGFHRACANLDPEERLLVHPGGDTYPVGDGTTAWGIGALVQRLRSE